MSIPPATTRAVTVRLIRFPTETYLSKSLAIYVDGVRQTAKWGRNVLSVPIDRAVTVAVMMFSLRGELPLGLAEYVVVPDGPSELEYRAPLNTLGPGALGPRGTTSGRSGTRMVWITVGIVGAALALGVGLVAALLLVSYFLLGR